MTINPDFDLALGDVTTYRSELLADAESIVTRSAGTLDPVEKARFEALTAEIERVDEDTAMRAQVMRLAAAGSFDEVRFETPEFQVQHRTDPGWDSDQPATRSSALAALEQSVRSIPEDVPDAVQETITQLLDNEANLKAEFRNGVGNEESPIGEWLRLTSSPAYVSAVRQYMLDPTGAADFWSPEERNAMRRTRQWNANRDRLSSRAMSETSTSVGGAVVPYFLDPSVNLTNAGVVSPIRNLATVKQITTNIWHGVTSAGVTAEWIGEATEVADASPTFVQPTITTFKADAYLQASMELAADAAVSGEVAALLADAKARLEGTAFVTGTGTAQPRGLISALSGTGPTLAGSSGVAGAADLVAADIFALVEGLPGRWRQRGASFLGSLKAINTVRKINIGTNAYQSTFWADFGADTPARLIGYPILEVSDMDTTIVSGSNDDILLFGDISQYFIIDRMGMEIAYNPMVLGANRRPTGEVGWVGFWRQGADCLTSNAFRLLRI